MTSTAPIDPSVLQNARDWVLRLASEDIGGNDLAALKAWLAEDAMHSRAFERERALWQDLEPYGALFACANLPAAPPTRGAWLMPKSRRRVWAMASTIAASLALMVAAPTLTLRYRADHLTGTGEVGTFILPDKSTAMLDSGSAIAVRYSGTERRVELLQGRAWFEVRHGDNRPFRVAASDGVAEDIGTAYEVAREPEGVEVAVSDGVVWVIAGTARPLILRAGQRAMYAGTRVEQIASLAPDRIATWRTGEILIDGLPLAQAVREVSRYRSGVTYLWNGEAGKKRVSGVFRTDRPDDALAALAGNAGLDLLRLPGGIVILR